MNEVITYDRSKDEEFELDLGDLTQTLHTRKQNKAYKWIPADSESLFLHNIKAYPNIKDLKKYEQDPIEYEFNNYGFRTPVNFKKGLEGNVFLGCSYTLGIGHHLENVWSWKVNEAIGGNFINFGIGGAGIGTSARLLYAFKDYFNYKNVFLHIPHPYRYEYYEPTTKCFNSLSPAYKEWPHKLLKITDHSRVVLADDTNMFTYYMSNLAWIEQVCREKNARLIVVKDIPFGQRKKIWENWVRIKSNRSKVEIARDMQHPGVSYMEEYARLVLGAYNNPDYINFKLPNKNVQPKIFTRELI